MTKVHVYTIDGINLSALWWDSGSPRSVLLLHMMPATKESWVPLAEALVAKGWNVLAPDFRGHGESGGGNYKEFTPEDHQKYILDATAVADFVEQHHPGSLSAMAGASIGANIMLQLMTTRPQVTRAVSLSAGLDYHGVNAEEYVTQLRQEQTVLFVGSRDDVRGSGLDCGAMAEQLWGKATSQKQKIIFQTGGHGTDLFVAQPELLDTVLNFFS